MELVNLLVAQVVLVMPDTSPRGDGIPDEESDHLDRPSEAMGIDGLKFGVTPKILQEPHTYDFGVGAGFYLNATTDKYKTHYNMPLG